MVLKNLTIGQMRSSVVFLVNSPTESATSDREAVETGGRNDLYSTLLTTRGRLRKKHGSRGIDLGLAEIKEGYELICRFQSTLESALTTNTKIVIDSKVYTINSWEVVDEIKHFYKFDLNASSEIVSVGGYPDLGIGTFIVS